MPRCRLGIDLYRLDGDDRTLLGQMTTNNDGRTDTPILPADRFAPGTYELVFHAGDYLDQEPRFLDLIPLRFGMSEARHYHVPLLLSPFSYATYRGS